MPRVNPTIRPACPEDFPVICDLIRALAEFEARLDQVAFDPEQMREHLFGERPYAEALLVEEGGSVAGFALFFHNYSTFLGRPGLYIEDLFILPLHRGKGYGRALLRALARLAAQRDCGFLEWSVLTWNGHAIRFYEALGAFAKSEWALYRLSGPALERLAE
jgi:GNAT superfamily N-acetyltransferase